MICFLFIFVGGGLGVCGWFLDGGWRMYWKVGGMCGGWAVEGLGCADEAREGGRGSAAMDREGGGKAKGT